MNSSKPWRLTVAQSICRYLPPLFSQRIGTLIYPPEIAYRDKYAFVVRAQTGSWFKNVTNDYYGGYPFSMCGFNHWRLWAIADALCTSGDTIIEVGANIGTETVGFSDIVGDSGQVFAFEPVQANLAALESTFQLNHRKNITLYPMAVGADARPVRFSVPTEVGKSGLGHIIADTDNTQQDIMVEVNCTTLDTLAGSLGAAKLLSIDAEGAEVSILRGGKNYLQQYAPTIIVEASASHLKRSGTSIQELHSELTGLGYEVYKIDKLGLAEPEVNDSTKDDWVCIHKSKANLKSAVARNLKTCGLLPCIPFVNPLRRAAAS